MAFPLPPWSAEALDGLMERHAIDAAVISLSPPGVYFGDQGLADELARLVHQRPAQPRRGARAARQRAPGRARAGRAGAFRRARVPAAARRRPRARRAVVPYGRA